MSLGNAPPNGFSVRVASEWFVVLWRTLLVEYTVWQSVLHRNLALNLTRTFKIIKYMAERRVLNMMKKCHRALHVIKRSHESFFHIFVYTFICILFVCVLICIVLTLHSATWILFSYKIFQVQHWFFFFRGGWKRVAILFVRT